MITIGSLCAGVGGLDLAVEHVTAGRTVWHVENEPAPASVLAAHWPGVPNYGDLKTLEWAQHGVDVLCGGFPCQPFSGAGKRLGKADPRHLWPWIAAGIAIMRPPLLLLENVRNLLNLGCDQVLADLDRVGYDVRWMVLPASSVGAPHERARVWIAARAREAGGWPTPAGDPVGHVSDGVWLRDGGLWSEPMALNTHGCVSMSPAGSLVDGVMWQHEPVAAASAVLLPTPRTSDTNGSGQHGTGGLDLRTAIDLLPTPTSRDHKGRNQRDDDTCLTGALLPTPRATDGTKGGDRCCLADSAHSNASGGSSASDVTLTDAVVRTDMGRQANARLPPTPAVNDMGEGKTLDWWETWTAEQRAKHSNGNGHGPSLAIESLRQADQWGPYGPAIARWEAVTGMPAPAPTEGRWVKTNTCQDCACPRFLHSLAPCQGVWRRWSLRLSPRLPEWMMGLPDGWVTDILGRNAALTACGNGVVWQCGAVAYTSLGVTPELFAQVAA